MNSDYAVAALCNLILDALENRLVALEDFKAKMILLRAVFKNKEEDAGSEP